IRCTQNEGTTKSFNALAATDDKVAEALAEFDDIDDHASSVTQQSGTTREHTSEDCFDGSSSSKGEARCDWAVARDGFNRSRRKTFSLALAAEDWHGDPEKEQLTTKRGEILKVIAKRRSTCKCLNSAGLTGWVPTQKLLRMTSRDDHQ
uniref:SH3 domain-containing protein n=1 Tax=Ascaris lumbricoides TaxID=6252 RepID=A0A0M3IKX6_ASCLU